MAWPHGRTSPDQLRQLPQVLCSEQASTCGHRNKRIVRHQICPTRRQSHQMAFFQMEEYPILAPVVFVDLQLELTSEQRMEWMSYPETSCRNVTLRCSRRRSPMPYANDSLGPSAGSVWITSFR
jgi:hypothetical protein